MVTRVLVHQKREEKLTSLGTRATGRGGGQTALKRARGEKLAFLFRGREATIGA